MFFYPVLLFFGFHFRLKSVINDIERVLDFGLVFIKLNGRHETSELMVELLHSVPWCQLLQFGSDLILILKEVLLVSVLNDGGLNIGQIVHYLIPIGVVVSELALYLVDVLIELI